MELSDMGERNMTTAFPSTAEQVEWVRCDCGQMMRRFRLAKHRARCKAAKKLSHCKHCAPASVSDVTDRLRRGVLVDQIAADLGRAIADVYKIRKSARDAGCLPRPTPDEAAADRNALALARHGARKCSECKSAFIPPLHGPHYQTCSAPCREKRNRRLKREARAKNPGYQPYEVAADASPEAQEKQMRALREREAWLMAEYERTGRAIEARREASYSLWDSCMGISR